MITNKLIDMRLQKYVHEMQVTLSIIIQENRQLILIPISIFKIHFS